MIGNHSEEGVVRQADSYQSLLISPSRLTRENIPQQSKSWIKSWVDHYTGTPKKRFRRTRNHSSNQRTVGFLVACFAL